MTYCMADLGPGLQSFLKVKVTLTLREVILRHYNKNLITSFRSGFCVKSIKYIHKSFNPLNFNKYS